MYTSLHTIYACIYKLSHSLTCTYYHITIYYYILYYRYNGVLPASGRALEALGTLLHSACAAYTSRYIIFIELYVCYMYVCYIHSMVYTIYFVGHSYSSHILYTNMYAVYIRVFVYYASYTCMLLLYSCILYYMLHSYIQVFPPLAGSKSTPI